MLAQDLINGCDRTAQVIGNAIAIYTACILPNGVGYLEIPCVDYEDLQELPDAVLYRGQTYTRTGWDSDRCIASYKTNLVPAYRM